MNAVHGAEEFPTDLDAVIAAPQHHRVLLENEQVRVLETKIHPGETVPLHTHRWPAVHSILSRSDFVRRDAARTIQVDTRLVQTVGPLPDVVWSGPLGPHTLENVGSGLIHVITVELKRGGTDCA